MNRREALKRTFQLTGYSIAASMSAGVLAGCKADLSESWMPSSFDKDQYSLVSNLAEAILPKTDTPGAKDVKVDRFIDRMVKEYYSEKERASFLSGLKSVAEFAKSSGISVSQFDAEGTKKIMEHLITKSKAEEKQSEDDDDLPAPFFKQLKNLTMLGYFTSEEVSKNVLIFDPIPGDYDGNYPLEKTGGRTWAI